MSACYLKRNIVSLLLLGCSIFGCAILPIQAAEPVFRILNWDDYIAPDLIRAFEEQNAVSVEYISYSSLDEFSTLFFDPDQHFDLVVPPSRIVEFLANRELIRNLDESRLQHLDGLKQDLFREYRQQDTGALNGIPYMWGTTGLGVNRKALAEQGIASSIHSWALLFDPELRQKAAQCGIGLLNERDELFAAALVYLGFSINTQDKEQLSQAGILLKSVVAEVSYLHPLQFRKDLAAGKICVAVGYSGDLLSSIADNPDLEYFVPAEGGSLWVDVLAIPANTTAEDMAYRLSDDGQYCRHQLGIP
jgi:putrescine transport system substrate-binding protein